MKHFHDITVIHGQYQWWNFNLEVNLNSPEPPSLIYNYCSTYLSFGTFQHSFSTANVLTISNFYRMPHSRVHAEPMLLHRKTTDCENCGHIDRWTEKPPGINVDLKWCHTVSARSPSPPQVGILHLFWFFLPQAQPKLSNIDVIVYGWSRYVGRYSNNPVGHGHLKSSICLISEYLKCAKLLHGLSRFLYKGNL